MTSIRPLPVELRDHLAELSGSELKIWLAYYLRTGDFDLTSHPGNKAIGEDTGICNDTVKTCKASLRAKGWLRYTGDYKQPRRAGGTFDVPVMEVRLPWRDDWAAVVTDVSLAYEAVTVVEKTAHGTVVENFHPEGSCSGSGSGSSSLSPSPSAACTLSDSSKGTRPKGVHTSKEKIEAKSKPENLEPKPQPTTKPTPVMAMAKGKANNVRCAPDGTPWPEEFNSWLNGERLEWLKAHGYNFRGYKQGRMVETASQKTYKLVQKDGKPSPPMPNPHRSAAPPDDFADEATFCANGHRTDGFDDFCNSSCRMIRANGIENIDSNQRKLDDWREL